jgi:hypothetical protein
MSVREWWGELGQLLADDAHLLAVVLVRCDAPHLVAQCRADAPSGRSLLQRGPHCFRVSQAVATDDLEGRGRGIVEANMK